MEEITRFSMKDCLPLPGIGLKYFISLRTEKDGPIYTYNDKFMRWFVRQAAYGGRVCAFNQYYISKSCDDILKTVSKELCVKEMCMKLSKLTWNIKTNILRSLKRNMKVILAIIEMRM